MAQLFGHDDSLMKSENEACQSVRSEEHDCIPLKQRLKMLLERKRLSDSGDTKTEKEILSVSIFPIDIAVKKEDEHSDSRGSHSDFCGGKGRLERLLLEQSNAGEQGERNCREIEANKCICSKQIASPEVNAGIVRADKGDVSDGVSLLHLMLPTYPVRVKVECTDNNLMSSSGNCVHGSCSANVQVIKRKTGIPDDFMDDIDHIVLKERQRMLLSSADVQVIKRKTGIPDDFMDDIDHIVLKERQRMLLSRKSLGMIKSVPEGNSSGLSNPVVDDMIQRSAERGKEESHSVDKESSMAGNHSYDIPEGNASVFCKISGSGSLDRVIAGSSCTTPQRLALARHSQGTKSTKSKKIKSVQETDRICFSKNTSAEYESCGGQDFLSGKCNNMIGSALSTFVNIKVEPLGSEELHSLDKNAVGFSIGGIHPVKSEFEIPNESHGDEVDHMLLRERMKLLASREVPNVDMSGNFEYSRKIRSAALNCNPIVSESAKPLRINRPRKRRKSATDSVETALEEDAPGLLQVLIDKGVLVDEIKLYGEMESDEALDDSFTEDTFSELEAVMSKLFSHRHSLLKFAPIRCTKGEKASYCLACLISLVEQAQYLQFRKWPVEWGWCRDLQSFIFVFERHNRIVLERPEYGYATYFFELVDSLPIKWQIKRLVTAMKLSSCSRVTLIENKALMVGEDLTEGEARVLMEYGWMLNGGLGTMLNYCDRVVHDRRNERDSLEWRSKIGKLLMDGYNGGTIVSTDIPKKITECSVQSPQIKLEL